MAFLECCMAESGAHPHRKSSWSVWRSSLCTGPSVKFRECPGLAFPGQVHRASVCELSAESESPSHLLRGAVSKWLGTWTPGTPSSLSALPGSFVAALWGSLQHSWVLGNVRSSVVPGRTLYSVPSPLHRTPAEHLQPSAVLSFV